MARLDDAGVPANEDSARLLRTLMEECLERVETDGLAVIDDVCERHPEIATHLRRRLKQLFDLGLLGERRSETEREFPERLGEFRLLRCLGGGGMGVVYLAEQESLGRRVALKLVRPEHLYFPGARERFRREAEAVARLKHEGIVAIHAVGEENGVPYFAMDWVEGATLAEVVRDVGELPRRPRGRDLARAIARVVGTDVDETAGAFAGTWAEACVRVARDVARALDHAHRQGVLHRDVKPSNVMMTPEGRVLLLDFGLATLGDAEPITKSGSQLGSMAYMAPEQVRGESERVDERTDVYSLGVTLFELLALQRPYPESDVTRLQMRIVSGDAPPLRRLAPDVPWDVETVCLKAMDPSPDRRYASAAELARDLDNVLELRPILAARPGLFRRAAQWTRRRPAAAVAVAVTTLSVLFVGATYLAVRERAAERVRNTLEAALDGIQTLVARLADPELSRVPELATLRQDVLKDAALLFRRLDVDDGDPNELRLRLERLRMSVASLLGAGGELEAALRAYDETVRRVGTMSDPVAEELVADALDSKAAMLLDLGRVPEAEAEVAEAIRRWDALVAAHGPLDRLLKARLRAHATRVGVLFATGRTDDAVRLLESGVSDARRVGDMSAASQLATLGAYRRETGDLPGAEEDLEEALALGERVLEERGPEIEVVRMLADIEGSLAVVHHGAGRLAEAETLLRRIIERRRHLVDLQPDRPQNHDALGRALLLLAELEIDLERPGAAEQTFLEAAVIERRLAERFPDHFDYRANLSSALGSVADLRSSDRPEQARPLYAEAIALLRRLTEETPEHAMIWMNLGLNQQGLWGVDLYHGEPADGIDTAFDALASFERTLELEPSREWARQAHLGTLRTLVLPLQAIGDCARLIEIADRVERWHREDTPARWIGLSARTLAARLDPAEEPRLFDELGRAVTEGFLRAVDLKDPSLDPWREDPRFEALLQKAGETPSVDETGDGAAGEEDVE